MVVVSLPRLGTLVNWQDAAVPASTYTVATGPVPLLVSLVVPVHCQVVR